jgi:hypothetical protein
LNVLLRGLRSTIKLRGAGGYVDSRKKRSPFVVVGLNGGTLPANGTVSLPVTFSGRPNQVTFGVFADVPPQ